MNNPNIPILLFREWYQKNHSIFNIIFSINFIKVLFKSNSLITPALKHTYDDFPWIKCSVYIILNFESINQIFCVKILTHEEKKISDFLALEHENHQFLQQKKYHSSVPNKLNILQEHTNKGSVHKWCHS